MGAFGDRLKRERERRKISLEDISGATKIGVRFLRALEEERFEQLPGGVFNKGFLRAYAHHVGLDEEQTVADYLDAIGESQPVAPEGVSEPVVRAEPEPERSAQETSFEIPWVTLAIGLLVIAFGFAIWGVVSRGKVNHTQVPVESPSPVASSPAPQPPQVVQTTSVPLPVSTAAPVSSPPLTEAQAAPVRSGRLSVLIKARDECWVGITADGKQSEVTLQQGDQHPVTAASEIILKAGNVGAVEVWFNGKQLPAQGEYGQVKTLAFDVHGLRPPPPPKPAEPSVQTQQP